MTTLFDSISQAHVAVRPQVPVSPLQLSRHLSADLGCSVLLKNEHLQPTGSFKIRGATNKIRILGTAAQRTGVTTASSGNHGQAGSLSGSRAGHTLTVLVSAASSRPHADQLPAHATRLY